MRSRHNKGRKPFYKDHRDSILRKDAFLEDTASAALEGNAANGRRVKALYADPAFRAHVSGVL